MEAITFEQLLTAFTQLFNMAENIARLLQKKNEPQTEADQFLTMKIEEVHIKLLKEQLTEIRNRLSEHDAQLNQIYDAIENLLDEETAERRWQDRQRIGFK